MLGFTIHLGPNTVMIAGPSNYKSRFIYYFTIAHYQEESTSHRRLIKKLWY